ncbi:MAG: 3'-5' exonuclease [Muribaculaceae bacterium]|jgi:DNA polymerase-3 subunit epsilon|nr:3'-5' exonuclease [Muribaculaceae bacterium]
MNDFIAIDVETANFEASSICAIGAVKVVDGRIADSFYSLVKPEPEYYCRRCTEVHGLTQADTDNAPCFDTVWRNLQEWAGGLGYVAHNAAFDLRCIRAACRVYRLDAPEYFHCTLKAARAKLPRGICPSKSLDSLCDFFGINLIRHHNALHDAEACAKLAIILL